MVTINELRNKKVTITMEPIVFNLGEDIGEDQLEEILKDILEDNPEISEEEVLNYFKDTFFNGYEIVDNLDLNFKVSIV